MRVLKAPWELMDLLDNKALLVLMDPLVTEVALVFLDQLDQLDQEVLRELREKEVIVAHQARKDQLDRPDSRDPLVHQDKEENVEKKDHLERVDPLDLEGGLETRVRLALQDSWDLLEVKACLDPLERLDHLDHLASAEREEAQDHLV